MSNLNALRELKLKAFEFSTQLKTSNENVDNIIERAEKIYAFFRKQDSSDDRPYPMTNSSQRSM